MARGHRRSEFIRSMRRETLWIPIDPVSTALSAVGGTIINSANAALLALRPFTIVRTRIELNVQTDQIAASENQVGGYGVAVVSDQAVAIGVTAVPTPITDQGSDLWLAWQGMLGQMRFTAGSFANLSTRYTIDSKAMRKVEDGQDVVFVGEFSAVANGMNLLSIGRMLIKLH